MDLWNRRFLEAPPISTYKDENVEVKNFIYIVKEATQFFTDQHYLEADAALLSRIIYRMKRSFLKHKGFKAMEKTNSALLRGLQLNFSGIVTTLLNLISDDTTNARLPTKNFLHYVLIRLQGFAKLLCRVVECCETVVFCMNKQINLGHNWKLGLIVIALMSRIWILSKNIVLKCCQFYSDLLPYAKVFKNRGGDWLPEKYAFPQNLKDWLEVEWIDKKIPLNVNAVQINKIDDHRDEMEVEYNNQNEGNKDGGNELFKGFDISEEIGEIIDTPTVTNKKSKRQKNSKGKTVTEINTAKVKCKKGKNRKDTKKGDDVERALDKINSLNDLKSFIYTEDKLRNKNLAQCTSKHIDKLQWNILRKNFLKEIKIAQKNETKGTAATKSVKKLKEMLKLNML